VARLLGTEQGEGEEEEEELCQATKRQEEVDEEEAAGEEKQEAMETRAAKRRKKQAGSDKQQEEADEEEEAGKEKQEPMQVEDQGGGEQAKKNQMDKACCEKCNDIPKDTNRRGAWKDNYHKWQHLQNLGAAEFQAKLRPMSVKPQDYTSTEAAYKVYNVPKLPDRKQGRLLLCTDCFQQFIRIKLA
jgi:hypothetical protein